MANEGALNFFGLFVDVFSALEAIGSPSHFQMVRLCLHERGFRPHIVNWEELVVSFLARARRALLVNPRDPYLPELIDEIISHPQAPADWRRPDWSRPPAPAIAMTLAQNGTQYGLYTMLAHFGSAQHVTLEELSVETFYPVDEVTRLKLESLAG